MGELLRKLGRAFQSISTKQPKHSNHLVIEGLEPRLLLSVDPIYSYADPGGVADWFTNAIAQPNLMV